MKKRIMAMAVSVVMVLCCFAACGGSGESTQSSLVVLSWGDYMDPELIQRFKDENPDIDLQVNFVTSNEEMYALASTEDCQVDIMLPSDYTIEKMIKNDMLAEINTANIENYQYVADFGKTCTFDPEGKYSVPYSYGTVGILYNTTKVEGVPDSWTYLWDEKYSKQIGMYDSVRDSMAIALTLKGYSINTRDEAEIKEAGELLKQQKPLVYTYGTDDLRDIMIAGSCAMAVIYSGDAVYAMDENEDLNYVVPKEGSNIWTDSFVVLKNSDSMAAAERFINYMLDPEVSAQNTEYLGYSNPSPAALDILRESGSGYFDIPSFMVTDDERARCVYFEDIEEEALVHYNDVWIEMKNQ